MDNHLAIFEQKPIRRVMYNGEMYFSIIDIIEVLTDSIAPSKYWNALKRREPNVSSICKKIKMRCINGKNYPTECANTDNVFIVIMSIPSPKAYSLKLWLAQAGKEKLDKLSDTVSIFELIAYHSKSNTNRVVCRYKTYLMKDILRGFYKIGKSKNPKIREGTLQAELPTIQLLHVIERDIEAYLHEKFATKRLRGEWFNLSEKDVNYIKSY